MGGGALRSWSLRVTILFTIQVKHELRVVEVRRCSDSICSPPALGERWSVRMAEDRLTFERVQASPLPS